MSDHRKRGSERDMEDGEVMEKFYHNADYLRYMWGIWTSNFGEPEGCYEGGACCDKLLQKLSKLAVQTGL